MVVAFSSYVLLRLSRPVSVQLSLSMLQPPSLFFSNCNNSRARRLARPDLRHLHVLRATHAHNWLP